MEQSKLDWVITAKDKEIKDQKLALMSQGSETDGLKAEVSSLKKAASKLADQNSTLVTAIQNLKKKEESNLEELKSLKDENTAILKAMKEKPELNPDQVGQIVKKELDKTDVRIKIDEIEQSLELKSKEVEAKLIDEIRNNDNIAKEVARLCPSKPTGSGSSWKPFW